MLFLCSDNSGMSPERQQFIDRLTDVVTLLKYPEHGRQTQIALRYKIKQPSVRKWFTGESMPSYEIALDLCKRALVHYEWLMTGRGPKFFSHEHFQFEDPVLNKGVQLLVAMEPEARPLAVRLLDTVAEPKNGTTGH